MRVKGVAYLARRSGLVHEWGEERTNSFLTEFAEREPFFKQQIYPVTLIPADAFLKLNEELLRRFYNNDIDTFWKFGVLSADWAFGAGPNRGLYSSQNYSALISSAPMLWAAYFDAGRVEVSEHGNVADVHILDVPIKHVYFEYSVLGYLKRGLELTGAKKLELKRIKGFSVGDNDILYQFVIN
jgi:hypothetical protein